MRNMCHFGPAMLCYTARLISMAQERRVSGNWWKCETAVEYGFQSGNPFATFWVGVRTSSSRIVGTSPSPTFNIFPPTWTLDTSSHSRFGMCPSILPAMAGTHSRSSSPFRPLYHASDNHAVSIRRCSLVFAIENSDHVSYCIFLNIIIIYYIIFVS